MSEYLLLGVDGGGTRCRVRITTGSGIFVGEAEGGSANIFSDPAGARNSIVETATAALAQAGLEERCLAKCHAGLGLAGANLAKTASDFSEQQLPFAASTIKSDAITACLGAHAGCDGGIAILGTGSAYVARAGGVETLFGGWGLTLSDGGSGADIGRAALAAALLAHDEMGPQSGLTEAILASFGGSAAAVAHFSRSATPRDYGSYCPLVWDFARGNDAVARHIIQARVAAVESGLRRLMALGAPAIALLGGLAVRYQPLLSDDIQTYLRVPAGDALDGALALARQLKTSLVETGSS
ncbi:BadF/BadG/BcrA/BcrD ATPase family protein [Aureimonas fodinaquatilis]|nr:BadF/BadG/BcrA/BcrD ATPase family protein [Aureimonas fodinaquatilis]